jgi:SAM-dependent methyltransferase
MIQKLEQHIRCFTCQSRMKKESSAFVCSACKVRYEYNGENLHVVSGTKDKVLDPLDKIKLVLKPFSGLYSFLIKTISPVFVDSSLKKFIAAHVRPTGIFLNLGSGNMRLHNDIINVDFIDYPNVDIVADISNIPLDDECCDGIFIVGVLEHVENPCTVIAQIYRLLKKGGFVYAFFPFMQGYHASPHDYFRTTHEGAKTLFNNFSNVSIQLAGGPTSGFLWVFQEWLAMILSLGIQPLYYIWYIILMVFTFPLKFLDLLLVHHPKAKHITSGFTIIAKK